MDSWGCFSLEFLLRSISFFLIYLVRISQKTCRATLLQHGFPYYLTFYIMHSAVLVNVLVKFLIVKPQLIPDLIVGIALNADPRTADVDNLAGGPILLLIYKRNLGCLHDILPEIIAGLLFPQNTQRCDLQVCIHGERNRSLNQEKLLIVFPAGGMELNGSIRIKAHAEIGVVIVLHPYFLVDGVTICDPSEEEKSVIISKNITPGIHDLADDLEIAHQGKTPPIIE